MIKSVTGNILLRVVVAVVLAASTITTVYAIDLSKQPKTIVTGNSDTSIFNKGDAVMAAVAQEVCSGCHSVDYTTTQPKLSCAVWAKEIVKMGNTFDARLPWQANVVTYSTLNSILVYLADNYGQGSASCDMEAVKAIPGLLN